MFVFGPLSQGVCVGLVGHKRFQDLCGPPTEVFTSKAADGKINTRIDLGPALRQAVLVFRDSLDGMRTATGFVVSFQL